MFNFNDLVSFLGALLRLAGLMAFGVAAGWFTLFTFRQPGDQWQLKAAAFLGFMGLSALVFWLVAPGGAGAYALGAGITLLYYGIQKNTETNDDPTSPDKITEHKEP